jgi:HK97 family phage major capsid protein
MERLKTLIEKGERLVAEADELRGRSAPETEVRAKCAEFDAVQSAIEEFQAAEKRRQVLAAARRELQLDPAGKDLRDPAQPLDHEADARAKEAGFWDYIQGKSVSDRMRDALKPKSPSFKIAPDGVVVPDRLSAAILGKNAAAALGKALPMANANNTVQTVPADFRALLIELPPEPACILPRATVVPAPYGSVMWPVLEQSDSDEFGGVSGGWITEGASKPDTEVAIDQLKISTYEYAAYTELTNRLLSRSAIQLEPLLTRLFRDKVMDALDTAFLVGSGVGQPEGVVTNTSVRVVARDKAGCVGYVDTVNLEHALRAYHRSRAIWTLQDQAVRSLKLEKDGFGRPLWLPATAGAAPATIVGYPYVDTHRLPALGSRGDVVFGDWSHYIVAMEEEVVVQRSEHYKFKNNVTAFRLSVVLGGKVAEPRAFAILDNVVGTTTQGNAGSTTTSG